MVPPENKGRVAVGGGRERRRKFIDKAKKEEKGKEIFKAPRRLKEDLSEREELRKRNPQKQHSSRVQQFL